MLIQLSTLVGLIAALVLAVYAFSKKELTEGGTVAAVFVGMVVFSFADWTWFALLIAFFVSSSLLTRFKKKEKQGVYAEFAKGGVRDFWQVMANGSLPAILSIAFFLQPSTELLVFFAAVVATMTADTWATELGVLSKARPWLVTTGEKVRPGASGAVSLLGLAVAFVGAALIAVVFVVLGLANNALTDVIPFLSQKFVGGYSFVLIVAVAGFLGALADSVLGATIQKMYWCRKCGKETERQKHRCGEATRFYRGWKLVDNDVVNFLSVLAGGLVAVALTAFLGV